MPVAREVLANREACNSLDRSVSISIIRRKQGMDMKVRHLDVLLSFLGCADSATDPDWWSDEVTKRGGSSHSESVSAETF